MHTAAVEYEQARSLVQREALNALLFAIAV